MYIPMRDESFSLSLVKEKKKERLTLGARCQVNGGFLSVPINEVRGVLTSYHT